MGGFVVQKYLQDNTAPAAVLLASVPPTGVWRMLIRGIRNQPLDVLKCNLTWSLQPIIADVSRARRLLFSEAMSEEEAGRHFLRLQNEAWFSYLDTLVFDLVKTKHVKTPIIVIGGSDDAMVHPDEVSSIARTYKVDPIMISGVAHDMMLDIGWRRVAAVIVRELETRFPKGQRAGIANNLAA
jgi:alpha-beta hydrolase superfamily lysophospholipase